MDSGWWKLQRVACRITKQTIIAWIQIVSLCNPGHKVFNMVMSFEQVTFYVSFLHVFHLSVYSRILGHNMFDDLTGFHFNWSITVDILGIMCRNKMHLSPLVNVLSVDLGVSIDIMCRIFIRNLEMSSRPDRFYCRITLWKIKRNKLLFLLNNERNKLV